MQADTLNTQQNTNAPIGEPMKRATTMTGSTGRATTSTERATTKRRLKAAQDKLWAILGLKMALDRLAGLKYSVVVAQEEGVTVIKVALNVDFDYATGMIGGRDIMELQQNLENQINALEAE